MSIVPDEKYKKFFEKTFWIPQLVMGQKFYDTAWVHNDVTKSATTIRGNSIVECALMCEMEISCRGFKYHLERYMMICEMFFEDVEFAVWMRRQSYGLTGWYLWIDYFILTF